MNMFRKSGASWHSRRLSGQMKSACLYYSTSTARTPRAPFDVIIPGRPGHDWGGITGRRVLTPPTKLVSFHLPPVALVVPLNPK